MAALKKIGFGFAVSFSFLLFFPAFGNHVLAAEGIHVEYHTQEEIKNFVEKSGATETEPIRYETEPSVTGEYAPGRLSEQTRNSALAMLNQIRYIAGIDADVAWDEEYEKKAQAGALVNCVNDKLSHTPVKPAGMSQELYELGYEGTSSSNIAWNSYGGGLNDSLVNSWMEDGDEGNISRVGHRRWCLNPGMLKTAFGAVGAYSTMYSFDDQRPSDYYGVAWPAQNMPVEYFGDHYPWTISMGTDVDKSKVTVTLTRESDQKTWTFSNAGADGYFNVNNDGYGATGCIIFRPSDISYSAGTVFHVSIEGLSNPVSYDVNFFNLETHKQEEEEEKHTPAVKDTLKAEGTYGNSLGDLRIQGSMVYEGAEVEGSFSWTGNSPEKIYPQAGKTAYKAEFIPKDGSRYEKVTDLTVVVTIAKKPITVTAKDVSVSYGTEVKESFLTFDVKEGDLVSGDTKQGLGIVLKTDTTKLSPAGTYEITKKETSGNSNYEITVKKGVLTITKAVPSIALTNTEETINSAKGVKAVLTPESSDAQAVVEYNIGTPGSENWTAEIPGKAGVYPVRAYLPEGKAGKNLTPVAVENAKIGTYTLKEASNSGSENNSGDNSVSENTETTGNAANTDGSTNQTDPETAPSDNTDQDSKLPVNNNAQTGNNGSSQDQDSAEDNDKKTSGDKKKKKTVKLNKKKAAVKVGRSIKLKVKNTAKKITWSSSRPKIARVNKNGKVTGLKAGRAVIKAKVKNGKTLKCTVIIKKA